jgi:hypothetical protein
MSCGNYPACICIPGDHMESYLYNKGVKCNCGENVESFENRDCAQHSEDCSIMKAYREHKDGKNI